MSMATTYAAAELQFKLFSGRSISQRFQLPIRPFDTGHWLLYVDQPKGYLDPGTVTRDITWGVRCISVPDPASTCKTVCSSALVDLLYEGGADIRKGVELELASLRPTTEVKTPLGPVSGRPTLIVRLRAVYLILGRNPAPPLDPSIERRRLAEVLTPYHQSHHPNDVRFVFPYEGRELWANSILLQAASPYLKSMLKAGLVESISFVVTESVRRVGKRRRPLDFDESDGERSGDDEETPETATTDNGPPKTCHHPVKTITIDQTSSQTYEAVLCWIATRHIDFAPLTSTFQGQLDLQKARQSAVTSRSSRSPTLPPPSSPKSIYRLAHLLELPALSQLALANIKLQLKPTTVAREMCCDMVAYEAFRKLVVEYAVEQWAKVKESAAMKEMKEKIAQGEMSHAVSTFLELSLKLN